MSQNLDLVRSIHAAWERGDYQGIAEGVHPGIEFVWADGPDPGSVTGWAQMEQRLREYRSAWEDYRLVLHELRELDDHRVLALAHVSGRGKASGLELEQMSAKITAVHHIGGGKVTRLVRYWDRDCALADLGLAE
jgi:ketosteroid isomerase-like protein